MSEAIEMVLDMQKWFGFMPAVLAVGAAGGMTGWFIFDDIWFVIMTFCAAMIAGVMSLFAFGREGPIGWGSASLGGVIATTISAFGLGLIFSVSRAFYFCSVVFSELLTNPICGIFWLVLMSNAHLYARYWRRLGNSDFPNGQSAV